MATAVIGYAQSVGVQASYVAMATHQSDLVVVGQLLMPNVQTLDVLVVDSRERIEQRLESDGGRRRTALCRRNGR